MGDRKRDALHFCRVVEDNLCGEFITDISYYCNDCLEDIPYDPSIEVEPESVDCPHCGKEVFAIVTIRLPLDVLRRIISYCENTRSYLSAKI